MPLPAFTFRRALVAGVVGLTGANLPAQPAIPADAIAIAIVVDTSGSMALPVATKAGVREPKYRIAQRAFHAVIARLEKFSQSAGAKPLAVGIYVFRGDHADVALPLAPMKADHLRGWVANLRPDGPTPLGDAMWLAARDLLATTVSSRHLLVLTDGENSVGRRPEAVLASINAAAERKQFPVFAHVIAFDVRAEAFAALRQNGATVIAAADESQLNAQFDFILEEKILVEAVR